MKKILELLKTKKSVHYAIIIIISLLISIPLIWLQFGDTHDGRLHILRILGLGYSFSESAFPYLVAPYYCCDWGYAMLAFYQTIVTYVPYVLGLISGSVLIGMKLFVVLTTILSGIFMYNFVNEVTKKKAIALFAAIFSGKFLRSRQSALRRLPAACFSFLSPHRRKAIFSFGAPPSTARKKSSASAFLKGSDTASPSLVISGSPKKEKFKDIARAPSINFSCTVKL